MNRTAAWFLLLLIGVLLVVVGFTGSLGGVFAVVFTPGLIESRYGGSAGVGDF